MTRKNEEPQAIGSVSFRVPDFVDECGVEYTDVEVIVEMNGIRDAVHLVKTVERPLTGANEQSREA